MELCSPRLEKLIFQEETCKARKTKICYIFLKKVLSHIGITADQAVSEIFETKNKSFSYNY